MFNQDKHVQHVREHIIRMFKDKDPSGTMQFQSIKLIDYITTKEKSQWWGNVNPWQLKDSLNKYVREYLYKKYGEVKKVSRGKYRLAQNGVLFQRLRAEVNTPQNTVDTKER